MWILYLIAILDGFIVACRLVSKKPRKVTALWVILGTLYGLLALFTIVSYLSLLEGSIILFGPIVLWILRVLLFGSRAYQKAH